MDSLRTARLNPIWVLAAIMLLAVLAASQVVQNASPPTGMVAAFVDSNGNDIDDTCEEPGTVDADPDAEQAANEAVDLDGDGTISVSEAAQSDRVGGKNCNHGGYVSWVAHGSCPDAAPEPAPALVTGPAPEAAAAVAAGCDETPATEEAAAPVTECVEVPPPARDPALDEQKNGHGKWVSSVAQSLATGGKNCNHGGAVSEAAKKDHEAAKADREAAKAEKKAAREAAKQAKQQGKGHNKP